MHENGWCYWRGLDVCRAGGVVSIGGVPEGKWSIEVSDGGFVGAIELVVVAGSTTRGRVRLEPEAALRVVVVDRVGKPIVCGLSVRGPGKRNLAISEFREPYSLGSPLRGLAPGRHVIEAEHPVLGRVTRVIDLRPGEERGAEAHPVTLISHLRYLWPMQVQLAGLLLLGAASVRADDGLITTHGHVVRGHDMVRVEGGVLVHFENGDVRVPDEVVLEVFLDQEFSGSPEEAAAALERLTDGLAHRNWRSRSKQETASFLWQFTIPHQLWAPLQERAERFHARLRERWNIGADPRRQKLPVNLYRDQHQFQTVSGPSPGTTAYFRHVRPQEVNLPFRPYDQRATESSLYAMLSFHAQSSLAVDFRMPVWPGEGLADAHSMSRWDEESSTFTAPGLHEARAERIARDLFAERRLSISAVVASTSEKDRPWRWALVHFLSQRPESAEGFQGYVLGLARDPAVTREAYAFGLQTVAPPESLRYLAQCLGVADVEELRPQFHAFLEGMQARTLRGLEPRAFEELALGNTLPASQLFEVAGQVKVLSIPGYLRYARLVAEQDQDKACEICERALELAPLEADLWTLLSECTEDEQEAQRLRALAEELGGR